MAVLGEMFFCPYNHSDFVKYAEPVPTLGSYPSERANPSSFYLSCLAKANTIWIVGGTIPELVDNGKDRRIYNTCVVYDSSGKIVGKYRKIHLFDVELPGHSFKESDTISPGDLPPCVVTTPWGFDIGIGICYDLRFPEFASVLRTSSSDNMKVLVYTAAFSMKTGSQHWELLGRARAVDTQSFCVLASVARATDNHSYQAWGHSMVISPTGSVVASLGSDEAVITVDIHVTLADEFRAHIPCFKNRRITLWKPLLEAYTEWKIYLNYNCSTINGRKIVVRRVCSSCANH